MAVKLKQERVDALVSECRPGMKPRDVIDAGGPGLILRLKPRGAHWGLKFERGDRTLRLKIGTPGILKLEDARKIAGAAREYLDAGNLVAPGEEWLRDRYVELGLAHHRPPRDERLIAAFQAEAPKLMQWRWEEARDAYLAEVHRIRRVDTWRDYRAMLRVPELARFAGRQVRLITRQELAVVVSEIHRSGRERQAEHVASVLRPFWSFLAQDRNQGLSGVTEPMPLLRAPERSSGVKARANGKVPGGYTATNDEIGHVLAVARSGALDRSQSIALELLVTTGQRRRPVAGALVVDFVPWVERDGWGVWSMGPAHRKTAAKRQDKHRHVVPLPPPLWTRVQEQMARAAAAGSKYLFPQVRPRRVGDRADGHLSDASLNHRLLDMGLKASPHDLRRGLSTTCQQRLRQSREAVKLILDHNEGFRTDDVLEAHYTTDDRLDMKEPVMEEWSGWLEAQAAAAALPDLATLKSEIARRRREREAAGKAKTAAKASGTAEAA